MLSLGFQTRAVNVNDAWMDEEDERPSHGYAYMHRSEPIHLLVFIRHVLLSRRMHELMVLMKVGSELEMSLTRA